MASLLQTDAAGLNDLASRHKNIYSIAPRCGVFAKTDVQPLLSEGAAREDIAMSIFNSVVIQTISGLACGKPICGKVALLGGPLRFLSELRRCFVETLKLESAVSPPYAHAMVCRGAALYGKSKVLPMPFSFLKKRILHALASASTGISTLARLDPLFDSPESLQQFRERHAKHCVEKLTLDAATGPLFLGIDSGSTTLKLVLLDIDGKLLYSYYHTHQGENLKNTIDALVSLLAEISNKKAFIAGCAVTGYGEHLLKTAIRADIGLVETIAHLRAARFFLPETDFIIVKP